MTDLVPALGVGGTKIAGGLVDCGGAVRRAVRVGTPLGSAEDTWGAVVSVVDEVVRGDEVAGVGIASAGPVDVDSGTVSPIDVRGWAAAGGVGPPSGPAGAGRRGRGAARGGGRRR